MASEFTLTSRDYKGRQMRLYCKQEKDIALNKSTITWTLYSEGGTSNYYSTGPTTVRINGVQVYHKARVSWDSYVFPAAKGSTSGTTYVDHNSDGSKTISVEMSTDIYDGVLDNYSGNWTLDSIPRQATIESAPDFNDSVKPTITYKNPAGNAVTSLKACISFTGAKDDVVYRDIPKTGTSYTFDLTSEEIDLLRNNTTGTPPSRTVIFYVRTTIGSNVFHSTLSKTFTVNETEDTKPSVDMYVTINNGNLSNQFDGIFIQGKTKVKVDLYADGMYGATIQSRSVDVDGKTYDGLYASKNPILVQSSGNITITGSATDSRGFKRSAEETIKVLEYSKPLVIPLANQNAILCYRSDSDGNRIGNSTSVWVKAKRFYYGLGGKNTCALQYRVKQAAEQWNDSHKWVDLIAFNGTVDAYYSNPIVDEDGAEMVFALDKSYTVDIRAIDTIGEFDIKTFEIPTQDVALHLGAGGKKVSVGTYCTDLDDYTFYSAWKAIFDDEVYIGKQSLKDYIKSVINEGG